MASKEIEVIPKYKRDRNNTLTREGYKGILSYIKGAPIGEGFTQAQIRKRLSLRISPTKDGSKDCPVDGVDKGSIAEEQKLRMREYRNRKIIPPLGVPDVVRPIVELPINRKLFEVIKDGNKEGLPTVREMQEFNDRNLPKIEGLKKEDIVFEGHINPAGPEIGLKDSANMSLFEIAMDDM